MIEVKNITKVYGKKENAFIALRDVTFSIPDGASVAIIGKSGSGKSTLMHIMSGLDHPDRGQIIFDGRNIHKLKRKAQDKFRAETMSFIFQAFFVEGNQTVYQNVSLPLEIAKVRRGKRKKMIAEALEKVELADKIYGKAKNLSGGQKQRLAIARAIVNSPKLIFADEPTGNLDSATGEKIIQLLFELNRTLGCTLVIVTHDEELAARCQMRLSLKDGVLVSNETTARLEAKAAAATRRQGGFSDMTQRPVITRNRPVASPKPLAPLAPIVPAKPTTAPLRPLPPRPVQPKLNIQDMGEPAAPSVQATPAVTDTPHINITNDGGFTQPDSDETGAAPEPTTTEPTTAVASAAGPEISAPETSTDDVVPAPTTVSVVDDAPEAISITTTSEPREMQSSEEQGEAVSVKTKPAQKRRPRRASNKAKPLNNRGVVQ